MIDRRGCEEVRDLLPGAMDDAIDADAEPHVGACLRCQVEVAQYRRLSRALRSLEPQMAVIPLGLHAAVMHALAEAQGRTAVLWKGALIGAGGLIVAAGTTAAGILFNRHRRAVG